MATPDDVSRIIAGLDGVTTVQRYGMETWTVGKKFFAWERPFSKADIKRMKPDEPPPGPILAVSVADLDDKRAILEEGPAGVFTISHFDGYAALLIQLDVVDVDLLEELMVDAWMTAAPRQTVDDYLAAHPRPTA